MEIEAKIYVIADDEDLLDDVGRILAKKTGYRYRGYGAEEFEPSIVLDVSETWYGFTERAEPTGGPEEWKDCLKQCAEVLEEHGAVVVEFTSPDDPDDYQEYAATTSGGNVSLSEWAAMNTYRKALGRDDVSLVLTEMMNGRTEEEREALVRRIEKKAAIRAAKGDFEIVGDKLVKYRGVALEETIPEGVRVIGESAFADRKQLEKFFMCEIHEYDAPPVEKLTIPEGVETIEYYALAYCENLRSVSIPSTVTKIEDRVFEGCKNLRRIDLPAGITAIEPFTFFLCEELRAVTIQEGVEKIGEGAFDSCFALKKIVIPKSVKEIGREAFRCCCGLLQVVLPEPLMPRASRLFRDSPKVKIVSA